MRPIFRATLLLSALSLAACGDNEPSSAQKTAESGLTIRIAHAAPLTGLQAHLGKDNENGVRLAIDELNQQKLQIGGQTARFELHSEDDQADPKTAATLAQKFVDQGMNGVIGHLNSGTTVPASRIYSDNGLPQISPSATTLKYTQQGFKTAFRVMTNDAQQGRILANYAVNQLKAKRIAIIDDRTAYGQGIAEQFEKTLANQPGVEIVKHEFTTDKSTDFMAILTSIKQTSPDLLFFAGMDAQGAPMTRQMQTLGFKTQFLGGDGINTPEFIKLSAGAAEGAIASLPGVPLEQMPGGKAFTDKFTAKYGQIQLYAPYCYDAVMVMAQAMQRANSAEPAKYLPELAKTDYQGVTSRITFDPHGDLANNSVSLYQVKNGVWQYQETLH